MWLFEKDKTPGRRYSAEEASVIDSEQYGKEEGRSTRSEMKVDNLCAYGPGGKMWSRESVRVETKRGI